MTSLHLFVQESGAGDLAAEIVDEWRQSKLQTAATNGTENIRKDNLKALIEQKTREQQTKFNSKKAVNVDNDLKQQLLAQYGEVSDGEER